MITVEQLYADLNPAQAQAASTIKGALLIIAGAGSGKTRVTTYRIAYMLAQGIEEKQILALTFTNKAASEMRERIELILGRKVKGLQILTFHAFGLYILRSNAKRLGYRPKFSIYDSSDKLELLKEVAEHMNLALVGSEPAYVADLFSRIKSGQSTWDGETLPYRPLFEEYESFLKLYNAFDFDDLVSKTLHLLNEFPSVLEHYRERYTHILVDEFQDTSHQQYELLHKLATPRGNICCVGDDDQSIYSWRGANYQNIRLLETDFPDLTEIKLEQNYRSTQLILEAANAVIRNNQERKDKALWSSESVGKAIGFSRPLNDTEEANFIAQQIQWLSLNEDVPYRDMAILVRTNALFRELELALRNGGIEYQISGGSSFFQKKEIKDVIAYLRVMVNPSDDFSLLRIINTPRRGIGKETLQLMRQVSDRRAQSLYESMKGLLFTADNIPLSEKAIASLQEFVALLEDYQHQFEYSDESYARILKGFLSDVGYFDYCLVEATSEAQGQYRLKNLEFFFAMIGRWENKRERSDRDLEIFLNMISLQTREDNDPAEGTVSLMTIHASKGLEWDIVFLAGVEEGIIPHSRTLEENEDQIEEERRLFYVALTRARKRVVMTATQMRKKGKETGGTETSRFVGEIPEHLLEREEEGNELLDPEEVQRLWKKFFEKREAEKEKEA